MKWTLKPKPDLNTVNTLANELNVDIKLAEILVQRGIKTFNEAKHFFRPSLEDLHDPFLMKDMHEAVSRVEKAIENGEKVLIYGDYDVDGTTSVSLMYSYLKNIHPYLATYIPDRYKEGYGVSFAGIDFAHDNEFSLIIALDCGIKAIEKVAYAEEKGIDFIICDHHKPGEKIPDAVAVLNPKRIDCEYPYKELCGCGVGFKLIQAIAQNKKQTINDLLPFLDLVVTAIGADIVPMTGENRVLAYYGLKVINTTPRIGIQALTQHINKKELSITDVVFIIAPRINAAGRIKHASYAVDLLISEDLDLAKNIAKEIEEFNAHRKELDKEITKEALLQIETNNEEHNYTTTVYDENWHKGVIGIVASRLTETYYRPTVVFTKSCEFLAASARSVKGFDVYNALDACSEYIEQFGGHKYAAGLSIKPENYNAFKAKFEEVVKNTIQKELLEPEIEIDAELHLSNISPKFYRIINQMAPFGPLNRRPIFQSNSVRDNGYGKQVGQDKTHLKLTVFQGNPKNCIGAIGFSLGNKIAHVQQEFDIVYQLDENTWNGNTFIQLQLKDLK
ncbi:single-stranded-DNA-specific exonuclease RecJ [Tenacibaculum jejuense]|uniref:Single-stranded-DNA-specific exonuclease RecJ n=1 Tax=Tenacibaculum jejuense TaxID=584609 RepID=A0A238UFY7_9FLAO|nr:single-stranded-DNA-specific exonuclease RecJ [Tenacibaculum jejuense]SNR17478.1 Single-stranded-DNA-specific exonuclease RecJ [Tenacibaculum jejuense]